MKRSDVLRIVLIATSSGWLATYLAYGTLAIFGTHGWMLSRPLEALPEGLLWSIPLALGAIFRRMWLAFGCQLLLIFVVIYGWTFTLNHDPGESMVQWSIRVWPAVTLGALTPIYCFAAYAMLSRVVPVASKGPDPTQ